MLEQIFKSTVTVHRLRSSVLGPYLDSFSDFLFDLRYKCSTVRTQLILLGVFGRWLFQNEVAVTELNNQIINTFLDERKGHGRLHTSLTSIVHQLLKYLYDEGVVPAPKIGREESTQLARIEFKYEKYLREERGLVQATLDGYQPYIHRFLVNRFQNGQIHLQDLMPADLSNFLLSYIKDMSAGRAQLVVTALRSFFRFLFQYGEIETNLADSIPTLRNWRLSGTPKYLTPDEVKSFLDACDRSSPTDRRNYAILLLLAQLGLRAGEVVALKLDDIDWRTGRILIHGKGLAHDWLPLPSTVGAALAEYLLKDRPEIPTRRLFVNMRAPHRGFSNSSTVSSIVRRALERAGFADLPTKGAHLLRHSLATRMLRNGASLSEIGGILRHRVISTTEIYAKLDFDSLRSLSQPWPGMGDVQ